MALADVVEQGGPRQVGPIGPGRRHGAGALEPVALVRRALPPEQAALGGAQPAGDPRLLLGPQRRGAEHTEEAPHQVARAAAHTTTRSTQPTAVPTKERAPGRGHDQQEEDQEPVGRQAGEGRPRPRREHQRHQPAAVQRRDRQHVEHRQGAVDHHEGDEHPPPERGACGSRRRGPPSRCPGPGRPARRRPAGRSASRGAPPPPPGAGWRPARPPRRGPSPRWAGGSAPDPPAPAVPIPRRSARRRPGRPGRAASRRGRRGAEGFRVMRPARRAVGSPSRSATHPWVTSWKITLGMRTARRRATSRMRLSEIMPNLGHPGEGPGSPCHDPALALHSTQSTDSGRLARRSAPISRPHLMQMP